MRKKIIVFVLLFVFAFGLVGSSTALAAETEDMKYSKYIDDTYVFDMPYLNFVSDGEPIFSNKFWIIEFGNIIGFEKHSPMHFVFGSGIAVNNLDIADVGFNVSDMVFRIDVDFHVVDDDGNVSNFSDYIDVPFSDIYEKGDRKIEYWCSYEDLIALYDSSGSIAPARISFTVYSKILKRCGSTYIYEFVYPEENYRDCSYSNIEQWFYNAEVGKQFLSDLSDVNCTKELDKTLCRIRTIHPEDVVFTETKEVLDSLKSVVLGAPDMVSFVLEFCFDVINLLPDFIGACIPFLPLYLIRAFMYVLYFAIGVGVYKLLRG